MKGRTVAILVVGTVVILATLVVVRFLQTHEKREIEVPMGPHPEVVAQPYLALERYLEHLQSEVDASPDPHQPEDLDEVDLIFMDPGLAIYEAWSSEVGPEWIDAGGHLILVVGDDVVGRAQDFVDALELVQYWADRDDEDDLGFWDWNLDWNLEEWGLPMEMAESYPLDSGVNWELGFRETVYGPAEIDFMIVTEDRELPVALSSARGKGRITVLTSPQFLTNRGMKYDGMGRVVADLMSLTEEWPGQTVVFLRHQRRGWFAEVVRRGWPFFAGLMLLLLLGFSRARRFGPPIPEPDRRRQRRREHVRATGHFLWKHHGVEALVDATRRALIDEVARRRPSITTMKRAQKHKVMAEELQISQERLHTLLEGPIPRRPSGYLSLIDALERLRRKL